MDAYTTGTGEPEHLLLAMAKSYEIPDEDFAPQDYEYSITEGAWVLPEVGSLLVEAPERPMQASKKADLESGEDQKGA